MARGRKGGPSRLDLRREAEAAEARGREADADVEEVEDDADDGGDDDGDGKPKPKPKAKKKAEPKPKAPAAPKKSRAAKEVRMRALWVVYDNSSKRVEAFPFNQKAEAEALLARKLEEKKGTFYIQLVKEPIDS